MRVQRLAHRVTCHVCEVAGAAVCLAWDTPLCVACFERAFVEMVGPSERGGAVPVDATELLTMAERRHEVAA